MRELQNIQARRATQRASRAGQCAGQTASNKRPRPAQPASPKQPQAASTKRPRPTQPGAPKQPRVKLPGKPFAARALPVLGIACVPVILLATLMTPMLTAANLPQAVQKSTLSNLMSQAQVQILSDKYKATLEKGQQIDEEAYAAAIDSSKLTAIAKPKITSISQTGSGILLRWKKSKAAEGYTLYRSTDGKLWEELETFDSDARFYHDTSVKKGKQYHYALVATTTADGFCNSKNSKLALRYYLAAPKVSVSKSGAKASISWKQAKGATSYTVQYASNSLFMGRKTVEVSGGSTTSTSVSGLSKNAQCYVRIRANRTQDGSTEQGQWAFSENVTSSKTLKLSKIKVQKGKKKLAFEVRSAAKQKTKGYDTLQGSCASGGYAYYALYNRTVNKSKIVKVRLSGMKVIKVSKALKIYHANDLTFNSNQNRIVAVHSAGDSCGVSLIDPSSLKVTKTAKISKGVSKLFDADSAGIESITGIGSIAYSAKRNCYVATIATQHDLLVLDEDFKATELIHLSSKSSGMHQNMELADDMIMVSSSAGGDQGGNYLWCYSWTGKLLSKICLPSSYELESVFFSGHTLHANFYVAKEVKKKKTVTVKKKIKNANGTVTVKKVKKKKTYTALERDNYCYKASGF